MLSGFAVTTVNNSYSRPYRSRGISALLSLSLLAGFVQDKRAKVRFPDPPPITTTTTSTSKASTLPPEAQAEVPKKAEQPRIAKNAKAIGMEVGYASLYGPDYPHRRGSNREVY